MLSSPYLVGRFWRLPAIIERRLVGWDLMACPIVPGERTKLSPLCSRPWDGGGDGTEPRGLLGQGWGTFLLPRAIWAFTASFESHTQLST